MHIIYEQNNRLLKKLNGRLNIMMLVLTLWGSYIYNIYEQNKRLLKDSGLDIMMFVLTLRKHALRTYFPPQYNTIQ